MATGGGRHMLSVSPSNVDTPQSAFIGILFFTIHPKGRVKGKNMRRDPRVGLDLIDLENPYRHLSIRGRVVDITEEGANAHIDKLAKKYLEQDKYDGVPGELRVVYRIQPERAHTW